MSKAKGHRINLRLSQDEYNAVKEKAGGKPLARWCREIVIAEQAKRKTKRSAKTRYSEVDPALIRQINAIGNNLNQVVRLSHVANKQSSLELWQLIESMRLIHDDLREVIELAKEKPCS